MILFWFFELIFVLSAPKYIGYDIKIVTFRKLFFRPLLKNNKKRKNFINSVHDHFRDKRLIKMIYQKNLVKVIDWEVFALNHTWFQFLRIFWNCVRFWSFFVENGILRVSWLRVGTDWRSWLVPGFNADNGQSVVKVNWNNITICYSREKVIQNFHINIKIGGNMNAK